MRIADIRQGEDRCEGVEHHIKTNASGIDVLMEHLDCIRSGWAMAYTHAALACFDASFKSFEQFELEMSAMRQCPLFRRPPTLPQPHYIHSLEHRTNRLRRPTFLCLQRHRMCCVGWRNSFVALLENAQCYCC